MAKIEINPNTGRPYGVQMNHNGRYYAGVNLPDGRFISSPLTDNMLQAKRQAEVIKALGATGASNAIINAAVKGVLS